jgi:hypothetical protein
MLINVYPVILLVCQPVKQRKGYNMRTREGIAVRVSPNDDAIQKRLELAERFGVNVSEAIRKALPDIIDREVKAKARQMKALLSEIPA